ncbi:response regulator transcription factor, partial [Streptomyces griseoincarnatus]
SPVALRKPAPLSPPPLQTPAGGHRLHLTEGTVKSHLARVYAKLGVESRTAAVAAAVDLGLIRR